VGDRTGIQWADATWNPLRGCSRVSEGCRNCYAEKVAARFSGPGQPYEGLATRSPARWTGKVRLVEEHLADPLRWTRPRRVFVNSMSDLFHERVPDEWIDRIFAVMALSPRHTFQVLTKRPERLNAYLRCGIGLYSRVLAAAEPLREQFTELNQIGISNPAALPLRNLWLGVSVEDQATADERIPLLLQTPAAVRFVSYEPALGPVDFGRALELSADLTPLFHVPPRDHVDWIIVGGESGPGARPFDVAWARSTIAQCRAAGVPVFCKQLGTNARDADPCEWRAWRQLGVTRVDMLGPEDGRLLFRDRKGGDWSEWSEDLRVRGFPAGAGDRP